MSTTRVLAAVTFGTAMLLAASVGGKSGSQPTVEALHIKSTDLGGLTIPMLGQRTASNSIVFCRPSMIAMKA